MRRDSFFQTLSLVFDTNLMAAINGVISSGLTWAQPQMRAAVVLYVMLMAMLIMFERMDRYEAARGIIRATVVALLLSSTATFNTFVTNVFMQEIPTSVGQALTGRSFTSPAGQFDAVWEATQRVTADMLARFDGWLEISERLVVYGLQYLAFGALVVMFVIWLAARVLMAMVIMLGPFLIGLWLFDATRPYVQRWIGKLVALTLVQLSASIVLQFLMNGFTEHVRRVQAAHGARGTQAGEMLMRLAELGAFFWCCVLMMIGVVVVAYSIGGGIASSFTTVTQGAGYATAGAARGAAATGRAVPNRLARRAR